MNTSSTKELDEAIEAAISNAVRGDPHVLRVKIHDWPGGLNAKRINELAAEAGISEHPVFEWNTDDGETVLLIYRPDNSKPLKVVTSNKYGMAVVSEYQREQMAERMRAWLPGDGGKENKRKTKYEWEAQALLLVHDHPDWKDAEIARQVGIDPSQLSRSNNYKAGATMARDENRKIPRGHRTEDGGIEAYDD